MPISEIRSKVPKNYRDQSTVVNQAMGLYLGYIKNAEDVTRNGRLQVWIPEFNSNPDSKDSWVTISYVSPFAGSTSIFDMGKDGKNSEQTQRSYGLWAIPYDKDTPVLVGFINGDPQMGVYLGSLHQEFVNQTLPGIGGSRVHDSNSLLPGAEKNRNDAVKDVGLRPKNKGHISALKTQGLLEDTTRGVASSSARRESPSRVLGILTPGQHQFVMDDGDSDGNSSMIRLRTKGGAQIMINDQHGMVYVISRDGKTWMELGNDGNIDIYAGNHVSLHAEKDFNIRAGNDVNIEAGSTVNIKGVAGINAEAPAGSVNVFAGQNLNQQAGANANLLVAGSYKETAARIDMNGPASTPASRAYINSHPANKLVRSSIASRVPESEPWKGHSVHTQIKAEGVIPTTDTVRPAPADVANDVTYEDIPPKEEVNTEDCINEEDRAISQPGIDFILSHEAYRPYEYYDFAGNSIGYGHNRGSGAKHGPEWEKKMDQGLTEEEAYELFRLDIRVVEKSVNRALKGAPCVTQNQFDGLVSMAYNTGNVFYAIVDGQKYDLTALYKAGDWDRVAQLIGSDNRKNGSRERRLSESKIIANAEYGKRADRQNLKAGGLAAARKAYPNGFGSNTFGGVERPRRQAEFVFYKETGRFLSGMSEERKRTVVAQAGGSVPSVT